MEDPIRAQLFALAEPGYKTFTEKLTPDAPPVLGVRMPALRKLAKTISKGDFRAWLENPDILYHEEVILQGLVIGCAPMDADERFSRIAAFVPGITNWAACDTFCSSLAFIPQNRGRMWKFLQPYFRSQKEFEVRFAVVTALCFYADPDFAGKALETFNAIRQDGYYVKMGIAWAVSVYYIKVPWLTEPFLVNNDLDDFTHNKSLQKITESFRVSAEKKAWIRSLKRGKK